MRLSYVEICGFRGFRTRVRVEFAEDVTVIDGRNGVGKSTVFDAIEFALSGSLSKYGDAKALRESVSDYVWWVGDRAPPDRFVEVGFIDDDGPTAVRRTPLGMTDDKSLRDLTQRLFSVGQPSASPIGQLLTTAIIRDEQISSLSLDMGETDRFSLLRDALGATDGEKWIARAGTIAQAAKRRLTAAEREVAQANAEFGLASKRLDQARASLYSDEAVSSAAQRMCSLTGLSVSPEQLISPGRERIAALRGRIAELTEVAVQQPKIAAAHARVAALTAELISAHTELADLERQISELVPESHGVSAAEAAHLANEILRLVELGRSLGRHDGRCPLCTAERSEAEFNAGMVAAERRALSIDERAKALLASQALVTQLRGSRDGTADRIQRADHEKTSLESTIAAWEARLNAVGLPLQFDTSWLAEKTSELQSTVAAAEVDLRVLETVRGNRQLEAAQQAELAARAQLAKSQERYAKAREAEKRATSLHDAARRAAAETLDTRLERVLPLMSELYRRLRPHPLWDSLEYSIRGDVRRFLKLQVGDGLNPQFMFSSGQRRATGLAFLLSVNLSLAWSRWRTILLDDPVQHIDDFRSVHLAEVLGHLVAEGRQVVCAVEDTALAELVARRSPIRRAGSGKRITLGPSDTGELAVREERSLQPLPRTSITAGSRLAAG